MTRHRFEERFPEARSMPTDAIPSSSTSSTAQVLELPLDVLEDSPFQVKQYDTAR